MRAAKRVMLSSEITPAAKKHLEPKLNASIAGGLPLILPVFWAQEAVAITEEQAALFKGSVYWWVQWRTVMCHGWCAECCLPGRTVRGLHLLVGPVKWDALLPRMVCSWGRLTGGSSRVGLCSVRNAKCAAFPG